MRTHTLAESADPSLSAQGCLHPRAAALPECPADVSAEPSAPHSMLRYARQPPPESFACCSCPIFRRDAMMFLLSSFDKIVHSTLRFFPTRYVPLNTKRPPADGKFLFHRQEAVRFREELFDTSHSTCMSATSATPDTARLRGHFASAFPLPPAMPDSAGMCGVHFLRRINATLSTCAVMLNISTG